MLIVRPRRLARIGAIDAFLHLRTSPVQGWFLGPQLLLLNKHPLPSNPLPSIPAELLSFNKHHCKLSFPLCQLLQRLHLGLDQHNAKVLVTLHRYHRPQLETHP
jgi:hypothetical protein